MKIAFIINDGSLNEGSIKSFLILLEKLTTENIETIIITPNKNELYRYLLKHRYKVFSFPIRHNIYPNKSIFKSPISYFKYAVRRLYDYYASTRIKTLCKSEHVDLIHSNSSVLTAGYRAAKWLNIPHITHIREYGDLDFNLTLPHLSKQLKSDNNYSIAITNGIAAHRPSKNYRVIYNGITCLDNDFAILPKQNYFLFAGRIEISKGIDILIDAFIEFCKNNPDNKTILKVTGDFSNGPAATLKKQLSHNLNQVNLLNRVMWIGSRNDITQLMSKALATIIPSRFEAFGRVMPEAISNGCLVIGKNTGGTKEQFDNGLKYCGTEIGYRFDTPEELATIMQTVATSDYDQFVPMIKNGYETITALYSTDAYSKSVINYYKSILRCNK